MKAHWVAGVLPLLFAGCTAVDLPEPVPALRLSPASLGHPLVLVQRLTVTAQGQSQRLDVALEADADGVRMAVVALGQIVARLDWDGQTLRETRAAGWPETARGERILGDLQLVHWPAEAVRAALPPGWTLALAPGERILRHLGRPQVKVRYLSAEEVELENLAQGYRLRIESRPGSSP